MTNKTVFGLSIDEEVCWIIGEIDADNEFALHRPCRRGTLLSVNELSQPLSLQNKLREKLDELNNDKVLGAKLAQVTAVGVSTIGLAGRDSHRLLSIARKDWVLEKKEYVLDFIDLFRGIFKNIGLDDKFPRLNIHNDATARCLAEYYSMTGKRPDSLYYVMISEGVNAGLVVRGWAPTTELHPEIGHILPRPHRLDFQFDPAFSGCPAHTYCFEGLASGARVRKTWDGYELHELKDHPENPWHRMAYYIAQICMNGVLAVAPDRILIGGPVVFPGIIELVRRYFIRLNSGGRLHEDGTPRAYLRYESLDNPDFIRLARIRHHEGERGALELARLAIKSPIPALITARSMRTRHAARVGR